MAGVVPGGGGGGGFHLHLVTPLSHKSDDSSFVKNYSGVSSIFCGKKNWDQIDNDVTKTRSEMSPLLLKNTQSDVFPK